MATSLTTGRPWRVILLFTLPLMIGNVVQQLYHFADTIVVGRLLGVDALIDPIRTAVNVASHGVSPVLVGRWEGERYDR